jgi:uncharacterized protein DUF955
MRKAPVQIAVPESAPDVTAEVRRLLRAAGIKEQLPTPKEEILACKRLVETGELDLAEYEATLSERAKDFFHRATSKIFGMFDRRSEVIYVDPHLRDSRKRFVMFHEVTHSILRWQSIVLTEDDENTISAECETMFEAEANFGAAEILFQCDRFENEARDYALSLESALLLSQKYDASCHATLRRFAERNHRACLLMILTPTQREYSGGRKSYYLVYSIPSRTFENAFGDPFKMKFINPSTELGTILNNGGEGQIVLPDAKGFLKPCTVQIFDNGYKTFALLYPKHLQIPRKTVRFAISDVAQT